MRFAAGLTVSGILGLLLLEALKIIMVPVTAWIMSLLAIVLKVVLVLLGIGVALAVGGVILFLYFLYRKKRRAASEA